MRMLATGQNCLPAGGIGAIAEQLASRLPADTIFTGVLGTGGSLGEAGAGRQRVSAEGPHGYLPQVSEQC
jgi:hypothetical protein